MFKLSEKKQSTSTHTKKITFRSTYKLFPYTVKGPFFWSFVIIEIKSRKCYQKTTQNFLIYIDDYNTMTDWLSPQKSRNLIDSSSLLARVYFQKKKKKKNLLPKTFYQYNFDYSYIWRIFLTLVILTRFFFSSRGF